MLSTCHLCSLYSTTEGSPLIHTEALKHLREECVCVCVCVCVLLRVTGTRFSGAASGWQPSHTALTPHHPHTTPHSHWQQAHTNPQQAHNRPNSGMEMESWLINGLSACCPLLLLPLLTASRVSPANPPSVQHFHPNHHSTIYIPTITVQFTSQSSQYNLHPTGPSLVMYIPQDHHW